MLPLFGELVNDLLLGEIGVLVLIHQYETEAVDIFPTYVLVILQQQERIEQQIVEIHGICLPASAGILVIDLCDQWHFHVAVALIHIFVGLVLSGRDKMVFGQRDEIVHVGRFIHCVGDGQLLDDILDERSRVALIIDGVVGMIAYLLGLHPEDSCEDAMEGTHVDILRPITTNELCHPLFHLCSSLVGEGKSQYVPGIVAIEQQIGHLVGKHSCFPRPCSGDNK